MNVPAGDGDVFDDQTQELLTELDTFLTRLAASERSDAGKRFGVGLYFFEDQSTDRSLDSDAPRMAPVEKRVPKQSPIEEIDVLAGLGNKK